MIIVGAGASGLFLAAEAAKRGMEVTLLEKNDRAGKKLLATGNGRCNYTNSKININRFHGENHKFALSAISNFNYDDAVSWFESQGVINRLLSKDRAYPRSLQSSSILEALLLACREYGVNIIYNCDIDHVKRIENGFELISKDGRTFETDKLVLATGGSTLINSGSDGSGYDLALSLGHSIIDIGPSIVQMVLKNHIKKLTGVRFDAGLHLLDDEKIVASDTDEVLFTDYGISGPAVLQLSGRAIRILKAGRKAGFKLDLFPEMSVDELAPYYSYLFSIAGNKTIGEVLIGAINNKVVENLLSKMIKIDELASRLDYLEIQSICEKLKGIYLEIDGPWKFDGAQVTTGGINTEEIDPSSMESKIVDGLYFIGEIIDIDGDCGGFNLHWAWASAYQVANSLLKE